MLAKRIDLTACSIEVRSWLTEKGPMMDRFQNHGGQMSVVIVDQGLKKDATDVWYATSQSGWQRSVHILEQRTQQVWMQASTWVPENLYNQYHTLLDTLSEQPIGKAFLYQSYFKKRQIEGYYVLPNQKAYARLSFFQHQNGLEPVALWEIFLPCLWTT